MTDAQDDRPKNLAVDYEDEKPMGDGQPPRTNTEPRGAEGSSDTPKTRTDPASGEQESSEQESGDIGPASLRDTPKTG